MNDQVKSVDVRDDSLAGGGLRSVDIKDETLDGGDIENESLTGQDVAHQSLDWQDINENGLQFEGSFSGRINDLGGAGTVYGSISGTSVANADNNEVTMAIGTTVTFERLVVALPTALDDGEQRVFSLIGGQPSTDPLSCTIAAGESRCVVLGSARMNGVISEPSIAVNSFGTTLAPGADARIALDYRQV